MKSRSRTCPILDHFYFRTDGANYLDEWEKEENITFIRTRDELLNYKIDDKTLIGLFAEGHLEYDLKRPSDEPELGYHIKPLLN